MREAVVYVYELSFALGTMRDHPQQQQPVSQVREALTLWDISHLSLSLSLASGCIAGGAGEFSSPGDGSCSFYDTRLSHHRLQ